MAVRSHPDTQRGAGFCASEGDSGQHGSAAQQPPGSPLRLPPRPPVFIIAPRIVGHLLK